MGPNHLRILIFLLSCSAFSIGYAVTPDVGVRVVHREPPYYPGLARVAEIEGSAEVVVHVTSKGQVSSVRTIFSTHPNFSWPAELSAWCSTFLPAKRNGSAYPDSIRLKYEFELSPQQIGNTRQLNFQNREQLVELIENQVCLYGNWLSGPVCVRLSEDRVYVGGVRVHPEINTFNQGSNLEIGFPTVLKEGLVFESRLLERELALQGHSIEEIRKETLQMLREVPLVVNAQSVDLDTFFIETINADTLSFTLPDPRDMELYFSLQPQMSSAETSYYGWLRKLHPGMGGRQVISTFQVTDTMSLTNPKAIMLREFVKSSKRNERGGYDCPPEIGDFPPLVLEAIRNPIVIKRL